MFSTTSGGVKTTTKKEVLLRNGYRPTVKRTKYLQLDLSKILDEVNELSFIDKMDFYVDMFKSKLNKRSIELTIKQVTEGYDKKNFNIIESHPNLKATIKALRGRGIAWLKSGLQRLKESVGLSDSKKNPLDFSSTWKQEDIFKLIFTMMSEGNSIPINVDINIHEWEKYQMARVFDGEGKILIAQQFRNGARLKVLDKAGSVVDVYNKIFSPDIHSWNSRIFEAIEELQRQFQNETDKNSKESLQYLTYEWLRLNFLDLAESIDNTKVISTMYDVIPAIERMIYYLKGTTGTIQSAVQIVMSSARLAFYKDVFIDNTRKPKDLLANTFKNSFWATETKPSNLNIFGLLGREYHKEIPYADSESWIITFLLLLPYTIDVENSSFKTDFNFKTMKSQIRRLFNKPFSTDVEKFGLELIRNLESLKETDRVAYFKLIKKVQKQVKYFSKVLEEIHDHKFTRGTKQFTLNDEFAEKKIGGTFRSIKDYFGTQVGVYNKKVKNIPNIDRDKGYNNWYAPFNIRAEGGFTYPLIIFGFVSQVLHRITEVSQNEKSWFEVCEKVLAHTRDEWPKFLQTYESIKVLTDDKNNKDSNNDMKNCAVQYKKIFNMGEFGVSDLAIHFGLTKDGGINVNVGGAIELYGYFLEEKVFPEIQKAFGGDTNEQARYKMDTFISTDSEITKIGDVHYILVPYTNTNGELTVKAVDYWRQVLKSNGDERSYFDVEHTAAAHKGNSIQNNKFFVNFWENNQDSTDNRHMKDRDLDLFYRGKITLADTLVKQMRVDILSANNKKEVREIQNQINKLSTAIDNDTRIYREFHYNGNVPSEHLDLEGEIAVYNPNDLDWYIIDDK